MQFQVSGQLDELSIAASFKNLYHDFWCKIGCKFALRLTPNETE